jgi:transposase-like protein
MLQNRKKRQGAQSKYSDAFKRQVAREYLQGDKTMAEVAQEFKLSGHYAVKDFVKWFRSQPDAELPPAPLTAEERASSEALLSRIKELEKQLDHAQLRAVGFETMIDIAEKELRIDIRKKSVTKQSK